MIVILRQNAHWKRLDDLNQNLRKKNFLDNNKGGKKTKYPCWAPWH